MDFENETDFNQKNEGFLIGGLDEPLYIEMNGQELEIDVLKEVFLCFGMIAIVIITAASLLYGLHVARLTTTCDDKIKNV